MIGETDCKEPPFCDGIDRSAKPPEHVDSVTIYKTKEREYVFCRSVYKNLKDALEHAGRMLG